MDPDEILDTIREARAIRAQSQRLRMWAKETMAATLRIVHSGPLKDRDT